MARPAFAKIDLAALRHNYERLRTLHGGRALAVLKANAYGHGAVRCAHALTDIADGFAVAFLEEAVALREAGINAPILVLEGMFDAHDLQVAQELELWIVVHHEAQLRMIELSACTTPLHVWLKLNTGMERAGFAPEDAAAVHSRLVSTGKIEQIILMSHFARADEPDSEATAAQIERFDNATAGIAGDRSLCNSAGVLAWPDARLDWARPGIALYGADPIPSGEHGLLPVMTLESRVFAVRDLQAGEALGYGARFIASRPTRVGLVAMGYADGYPRTAPEGTAVMVDGQVSGIIGRVSMDMLTVDITDHPSTGIGSRLELWGPRIRVNDVAHASGTIAYELLCNVKRVPLQYSQEPLVHTPKLESAAA
ncbi:Alanine racemase (plasmid) [Cupriavidus necator H850]|uniref:alanine racemase n=1 Tax=Cupriavidus necator TaxID=106590 RepID=UPI00129D5D67|nr:alanine racemase [Cupriavidus necator]KAI3606027.1 Alanine racemase [Cupriavidus necator H850]